MSCSELLKHVFEGHLSRWKHTCAVRLEEVIQHQRSQVEALRGVNFSSVVDEGVHTCECIRRDPNGLDGLSGGTVI